MNRPAVWVALGLFSGILGASYCPWLPPWLALLIPPVFWLAAAPLSRWLPRDGLYVAGLFACAGVFLWQATRDPASANPLFLFARDHPGESVEIEGWVRQGPVILDDADYARLLVQADTLRRAGSTLAVRGGIVLRWYDPTGPVLPGQRIAITGKLDPSLGTVNAGVSGMEDRLRAAGYHATLTVKDRDLQVLSTAYGSPRYWAARLRQWEAGVLARSLPEHALPLAMNIWLGDRSHLTQASYRQFLASGTAHILAVSGVHIGIIFLSLRGLLRLLRRRGRAAAGPLAAGVLIYGLAAGASISVLRAMLMVILYLAAELVHREPDARNALAWAAIIFLVLNPALVYDAAFLLSFGSVASILLFADVLESRLNFLPVGVRGTVAVTAGVQCLPFPLAVHYFHILPVLGFFANLLVVPLLSAALWLLALTVVAAPVLPGLAVLIGHAAAVALYGIQQIVALITTLQGGPWYLAGPTPVGALAFWAAVAALWWGLQHRQGRRAWIAVALAALVSIATWIPWRQPDALDVLDVGHGDALVVRTQAGGVMLVDGGDRDEYRDLGQQVVLPYLLAHGIQHIDTVVATHSDRDHLGGLLSVVDGLSIGEVVLGPARPVRSLEESMLRLCAERGIPVRRVAAGDRIPLVGATVSVLHPPATGFEGLAANENSVVLRVAWPQGAALLTGDIESAAEGALCRLPIATELLKVPHHGSATSSSPAFLDAVRPSGALVSTHQRGTRKPIGRGVAETYAARGLGLWRTDLHGGLQAIPTDAGWQLSGARAGRGTLLAPRPGD